MTLRYALIGDGPSVAEAVPSFAPLLELPAFQAWQRDLGAALGRLS